MPAFLYECQFFVASGVIGSQEKERKREIKESSEKSAVARNRERRGEERRGVKG